MLQQLISTTTFMRGKEAQVTEVSSSSMYFMNLNVVCKSGFFALE